MTEFNPNPLLLANSLARVYAAFNIVNVGSVERALIREVGRAVPPERKQSDWQRYHDSQHRPSTETALYDKRCNQIRHHCCKNNAIEEDVPKLAAGLGLRYEDVQE